MNEDKLKTDILMLERLVDEAHKMTMPQLILFLNSYVIMLKMDSGLIESKI